MFFTAYSTDKDGLTETKRGSKPSPEVGSVQQRCSTTRKSHQEDSSFRQWIGNENPNFELYEILHDSPSAGILSGRYSRMGEEAERALFCRCRVSRIFSKFSFRVFVRQSRMGVAGLVWVGQAFWPAKIMPVVVRMAKPTHLVNMVAGCHCEWGMLSSGQSHRQCRHELFHYLPPGPIGQ